MLNGRPAIFISCSERFRTTLARRFRQGIERAGLEAIVVSESPLIGAAWTPEEKVEAYLNIADAVVVLATPDDQLGDGTWRTRENIIDEIGRARLIDRLRSRIYVLKAAEVRLPSNINPAYDKLDPRRPAPALKACLKQLGAWGLSATARSASSSTRASSLRLELVDGLEVAEPKATAERLRHLVGMRTKKAQRELVRELAEVSSHAPHWEQQGVASQMLQTVAEIDPGLLETDVIDVLSRAENFIVRSNVAVSLFLVSTFAPGVVPIDIVARLATPSAEDWYVYTPALNCLKELAISRPEAIVALGSLARSNNRDDREYAAVALRDVARIRPEVVPPQVAKALSRDIDGAVAAIARQVLDTISGVADEDRRFPYQHFGAY